MDTLNYILIVALIGVVAFFIYRDKQRSSQNANLKTDDAPSVSVSDAEKERILAESRAKAKEIIVEAKDEAFKLKKHAEDEVREARQEFLKIERGGLR